MTEPEHATSVPDEPTPAHAAAGPFPTSAPADTPAPTEASVVTEALVATDTPVAIEPPSAVAAPAAIEPPQPTEATAPAEPPKEAIITAPASAPASMGATASTAKEGQEPQNALTAKFTEAEWTALKEFRTKLPEIFAAAYTDDPKASTKSIKLWGVTIDPAHPAADARVSVILMKFLRARNLNPTAAQEMLVATLRWRDEFRIDDLMKEKFPADVFGQLAHIYGKDKHGCPIVYNVYGGNQDLKAVFGDVPRFLRWRVQVMEQCVLLLDFVNIDQMIQVHDYEGVSMASRDANSKNAASEASSTFNSHYPEFLVAKFFVNVPTLMSWIFWVVKPLIPARTVGKMHMIGSGPHVIGKALLPLIDETELPRKYGGGAEGWPEVTAAKA